MEEDTKKRESEQKKAAPSLEEIKKEAAERKTKQLAQEEAAKEERRKKAKEKMAEQMAGFNGGQDNDDLGSPERVKDEAEGSKGDLDYKWMEEDSKRRAAELKASKKREEEERKELSAVMWQEQEAERKAKREEKSRGDEEGNSGALDDWGKMGEALAVNSWADAASDDEEVEATRNAVRESPKRDDQVARRLIAGALGIRTRPKVKKKDSDVGTKKDTEESDKKTLETDEARAARLTEEAARKARSEVMWQKQQADRQLARQRKLQVKASTNNSDRWETCVDSEGEEV